MVLYDAGRGSILRALAVFSFAKAEAMELVPEGAAVPDGVPSGVTVLQQPLDQIYLVAAAAMEMCIRDRGMAVGVMYAGFLAGNAQITAASALVLSLGIAIQNFPEGAIISMPLDVYKRQVQGDLCPYLLLAGPGIQHMAFAVK